MSDYNQFTRQFIDSVAETLILQLVVTVLVSGLTWVEIEKYLGRRRIAEGTLRRGLLSGMVAGAGGIEADLLTAAGDTHLLIP